MINFGQSNDGPILQQPEMLGTQYVEKRSWIVEDETGVRVKVREIATVEECFAASLGPPRYVTTKVEFVTDGGQPAFADDPSYTVFRVMTRGGVRLMVVQE